MKDIADFGMDEAGIFCNVELNALVPILIHW
jgi:hypothetical protein